VPWETDVDGGQALAEFAGRACYQSWSKPNPATATNAGYLRHILEVGHLSVLEHGSVTFYLTGISRSLTHELIRHRHFSYSQLSQRYVPERDAAMVEPAVIAEDPELHALFLEASEQALESYTRLLEGLEKKFADVDNVTSRRKQARQAARAVLPERHRDAHRRHRELPRDAALRRHAGQRARRRRDPRAGDRHARELQRVAPNAFADFEVSPLGDGTEVASSPLVGEG
jgi:thymidylate synthase (FAD)